MNKVGNLYGGRCACSCLHTALRSKAGCMPDVCHLCPCDLHAVNEDACLCQFSSAHVDLCLLQEPAPIAGPARVPPGGGEAARVFSAALKQEDIGAGQCNPMPFACLGFEAYGPVQIALLLCMFEHATMTKC